MKTLNAVLILLIFILVYCPSECFEISNCCLTEGGGGDRVKETTRTSVYPNAYPIYKKKRPAAKIYKGYSTGDPDFVAVNINVHIFLPSADDFSMTVA